MTKLEKAREKIDSLIDVIKDYSEDTWKDSKEALLTLKDALEKQIPKKPTHEATLYRCLTCPTCKNVIDEFTEFIPNQPKIRVKTLHCKFCGQALDWGDSE